MTQNLHVVSTGTDRVWLVDAEDWKQAQKIVQAQYDDDQRLYDEGTLDEYVNEANRDGIALFNP